MSMHTIPLFPMEEEGLKAHGLDIGTPSQLSDVFRQGIHWAIGSKARRIHPDTRQYLVVRSPRKRCRQLPAMVFVCWASSKKNALLVFNSMTFVANECDYLKPVANQLENYLQYRV